MHLTNYAINAKNKGKFIFNKNLDDADQGHKRTFTSVLEHIQDSYDDGDQKVDTMMHKIEQLIIKTMITVQPSLKHYLNIPNKAQYSYDGVSFEANKINSMCFEILGFDVLIDDKLKPWLIEINHAPSFATDTPLDFKMKKDVVADAIQILGMTYKRKQKFIKSHKNYIKKRQFTKKVGVSQSNTKNGKSSSMIQPKVSVLSPKPKGRSDILEEDPEPATPLQLNNESEEEEDDDEYQNQYKLIYPSERNTESYYQKFFDHSQKCYE